MSILFHAYPLARPALFAMDAETAHEVTLSGLQRAYECGATRKLLHADVYKRQGGHGLFQKRPMIETRLQSGSSNAVPPRE